MIRVKQFFNTTLLGGLAAILPLALIFVLFNWIINLIERYLEPLVKLVEPDTKLATILTYTIAVAGIIAIFFFIGLFVRTRMGNIIRDYIEHTFLMKIPIYKTMREIVMQFFGKNKSFFKEVVLVDVFNTGTLMTGFITDEMEHYYSVFIPTGPNPTSGNIFHVKKELVTRSEIGVDAAVKSIISCGAGSVDVFKMVQKKEVTSGKPQQ